MAGRRTKAVAEGDVVDRFLAHLEQGPGPARNLREFEALLRILRVAAKMNREMEQEAGAVKLTLGQVQVLGTLRWHEPAPVSPSQLLDVTSLTSGALTALLDRLEERKLIVRAENPEDRRGVHLRLTDTGRILADERHDAHVTLLQRWNRGLTKRGRAELAAHLRGLLRAVAGPGPA